MVQAGLVELAIERVGFDQCSGIHYDMMKLLVFVHACSSFFTHAHQPTHTSPLAFAACLPHVPQRMYASASSGWTR